MNETPAQLHRRVYPEVEVQDVKPGYGAESAISMPDRTADHFASFPFSEENFHWKNLAIWAPCFDLVRLRPVKLACSLSINYYPLFDQRYSGFFGWGYYIAYPNWLVAPEFGRWTPLRSKIPTAEPKRSVSYWQKVAAEIWQLKFGATTTKVCDVYDGLVFDLYVPCAREVDTGEIVYARLHASQMMRLHDRPDGTRMVHVFRQNLVPEPYNHVPKYDFVAWLNNSELAYSIGVLDAWFYVSSGKEQMQQVAETMIDPRLDQLRIPVVFEKTRPLVSPQWLFADDSEMLEVLRSRYPNEYLLAEMVL